MDKSSLNDQWLSGAAYERFMGRWSAPAAGVFLNWLAVPPHRRWLDVGCGTGSLTKQILAARQPKEIIAIDSSGEFVAHARSVIIHPSVHFQTGLAQAMDLESSSMDVVVSGLVLNFIPQPETAVDEMMRVARPGGMIGIFIWDYAAGMQMLRCFWDAAVELDHNARAQDEGVRFPLCQEGRLESLVQDAGMLQIETNSIEVKTVFQNFDDYWQPFLSGVGPAPSYVSSLAPQARQKLAEKLRLALPVNEDGSIHLIARAWAVKGITAN